VAGSRCAGALNTAHCMRDGSRTALVINARDRPLRALVCRLPTSTSPATPANATAATHWCLRASVLLVFDLGPVLEPSACLTLPSCRLTLFESTRVAAACVACLHCAVAPLALCSSSSQSTEFAGRGFVCTSIRHRPARPGKRDAHVTSWNHLGCPHPTHHHASLCVCIHCFFTHVSSPGVSASCPSHSIQGRTHI
jgi:hypothetical protein